MWYIIFPYAVLPSLPYIIHRFNEFGEPISYDTPLRSLYHTICYTVTCLPADELQGLACTGPQGAWGMDERRGGHNTTEMHNEHRLNFR
jgi:hypothetical protein